MDLMTYLLATQNGGGGGGGSDLPEVTSTDNGKILKVINAEWGIGSDDNDNDKVKQTPTTDQDSTLYPIIIANSANGVEEINGVKTSRPQRFQYQPSTNTLKVNVYNNDNFLRGATYGSSGFFTSGVDVNNKNINASYKQDESSIVYGASHEADDLTDARIRSYIDMSDQDGPIPSIGITQEKWKDDQLSEGTIITGEISSNGIEIMKDKYNESYPYFSEELKYSKITPDDIQVIHEVYPETSGGEYTSQYIQIKPNDIIIHGGTWDGVHTSLIEAFARLSENNHEAHGVVTSESESNNGIVSNSINGTYTVVEDGGKS